MKSGITFRHANTEILSLSPPVKREIVFNTDTGEHGWINENNEVVYNNLRKSNDSVANIYKGTNTPSKNFGSNGDIYMQEAASDIFINEITIIRNNYTEWCKINDNWQEVNKYRIIPERENFREYTADPQGTVIYYIR